MRAGLIPANADANSLVRDLGGRTSLDAALARDAPKGANPVALTDANLIAGIDLYGRHCAICHGTAEGRCLGFADRERGIPGASELADGSVPEGYSFWNIAHGIRQRHALMRR